MIFDKCWLGSAGARMYFFAQSKQHAEVRMKTPNSTQRLRTQRLRKHHTTTAEKEPRTRVIVHRRFHPTSLDAKPHPGFPCYRFPPTQTFRPCC